jgi:ribonucleoside-diphosphate reductase beta chain
MKEVMGSPQNLESYHGPMYRILFYEKLPNALNALWTDSSPAAQLKASATYNMIVEGTLAETGYEAYFNMLEERDLLPGLREGITYLKRDESRHIAFALHFLGRLLAEHPSLTGYLEEELGILLGDATNIVHEIFDRYGDEVPFGLNREWFLNYAVKQFQNRIQKLGLG